MNDLVQMLTERSLFGVSLLNWAIELGLTAVIAVALLAARAALKRFYTYAARRSDRPALPVLSALASATRTLSVIGFSAWIADSLLGLPRVLDPFFRHLVTLALLYQAGHWSMAIVELLLERYRARNQGQRDTAIAALPGIRIILGVITWALVGLVALDQLGVNVTALIAGLGIGGIAVALAVQKALGDLLAYISIVADEPFQLGDFLNVDGYMGNVDTIGLRSTRIRSLSGEEIIFPNSDLLASRIRNFGSLRTRRVVFGFGVLYQTTPEQAQRIPELAREIIDSLDGARFDRAHFKGYGDSSLDYEVVYHVLSPEYAIYMDLQQEINLALMRRLAAMGVDFAYPTRTLFIEEPGEKVRAPATDVVAAPGAERPASGATHGVPDTESGFGSDEGEG